jgi:hypothetical protein
MKKIIESVTALAEQEMAWGIRKNGYFHSMHEGYGVMREELDEAQDELDIVEMVEGELWDRIRCDDSETAVKIAEDLAERAILASAELIQAAAMAMKFSQSEGEDGKRYWGKVQRLTKEVKP